MQYVNNFDDVKLLDMANGEKLEKWGDYLLIRPDPQIIWSKKTNPKLWEKADARYIRSKTGGGHWELKNKLPDSWQVSYNGMIFNVKPMGFKHTGLFPEQAVNWQYMMEKIKARKKEGKSTRVLNLFAYTGGATVACAKAGASVCHVDSSKGMVLWAKENLASSGLKDASVRFIVDDVIKFLEREKRRGRTYHGIIMDPPSYGRGPKGEVWRLEDNLQELLLKSRDVLDEQFSFLLINSYTTGVSPTSLKNILKLTFSNANVETGEIGLPVEENNLILPCGIYGRVTKD